LAHELAHLCRRDNWVRWLEVLVQGVYWWYPLVPLARRQIQLHEEECCDALVTDLLPARSYASAIIRTLGFLAGDVGPLPAPASGLGRVATLKRRLTRIMHGGVPGTLGFASRLALAAVALGLLPLLPTLAESSRPPAERAPDALALLDSSDPDDEV